MIIINESKHLLVLTPTHTVMYLPDLRSKSVLDYQDIFANEINLTTFDDLDEQHKKFQHEMNLKILICTKL